MKYFDAKIARLLINFFGNDDRRISHAISVLFHAKQIAAEKGNCDDDIIVASSLLHAERTQSVIYEKFFLNRDIFAAPCEYIGASGFKSG